MQYTHLLVYVSNITQKTTLYRVSYNNILTLRDRRFGWVKLYFTYIYLMRAVLKKKIMKIKIA